MKLTPNFYRDRVCLNVLAGSKDNAREIYDAAEGHVLVGVLSKNYPDVASAVAGMTRVGRVFLPQAEARQIYQRLYGEVYLRMYRQLRPLYRSIREITGYPA